MTPQPQSCRSPRRNLLALAALTLALPGARAESSMPGWLTGDTVRGSGTIKTQTRALGHFSGISLGMAGQVEVRLGNVESVSIEADDNVIPLIETVVEDGNLEIRLARSNTSFDAHGLKIVVQAREIDRLALGGAGTIEAATLRAPRLKFSIGGSGSINVKDVQSESVQASIGGSGNLKLAGATRALTVSIGGSGDVRAGQLKAKEAKVSIGGSGRATVWVSEALKVAIGGSGDVNYYGDPKVSSAVVGSGGAKRLGAAPGAAG